MHRRRPGLYTPTGLTLLTPRVVPLSTPLSSAKYTRNRRVILQERFHRVGAMYVYYMNRARSSLAPQGPAFHSLSGPFSVGVIEQR
jgi:hypothetical protein